MIPYTVEGDGMGWKEGKVGQGKVKRLETVVGETSQSVVKKCEKEELGRISHFFEVKHCYGLTELIRSAVFKNK